MAALQWIKTVWTKLCWTSVLEAILGNIMHSTAMQYINTIHFISINWTALPGSCWEAKLVSWPRGGRVLSSPLPSFYHQSFTEFPERRVSSSISHNNLSFSNLYSSHHGTSLSNIPLLMAIGKPFYNYPWLGPKLGVPQNGAIAFSGSIWFCSSFPSKNPHKWVYVHCTHRSFCCHLNAAPRGELQWSWGL